MPDNSKENSLNHDSIVSVISSEKFTSLSTDMQELVLNTIESGNKRDGGLMGKLFGNKRELASMNIAFLICILLFVSGIIVGEQQYWDKVLPIVAAAIGYIFGKGSGKAE